jgi:hypothetical protein
MAQAVVGSPIRRIKGTTVSMTTTAQHLAVPPGYHEIKHFASSAYRLGLAPKLIYCLLATTKTVGTATYTDYTTHVTDGISTTHLPLDAMAATKAVYLGFSEFPRGVYFDIGTNVQAEAATLDVEYCYDAVTSGYKKITGTISGALTVGETVTGGTSGATATLVESGATYIVVKSITGHFALGETISGAAQNCSAVTAIADEPQFFPYFTDVAGDSDGTAAGGATLAVDGLYSWTLPAGVESKVNGKTAYWIRFNPSATLSATVDINEIIPACIDVNYGYFEANIEYQYSLNTAMVGAIETDLAASTATLDVTFIQH